MASLSQGRTAAAQCGLFTYKSVPVIFEPPCTQARLKQTYQVKTANSKLTCSHDQFHRRQRALAPLTSVSSCEVINVCDYIIMSLLLSSQSLSILVTVYIVDSAAGGQSDFPFSSTAIPALGTAQPPIRRVTGRERDHSPPMPRLRMSGAIPLFPYRPSWRGQGQLYLFYWAMDK